MEGNSTSVPKMTTTPCHEASIMKDTDACIPCNETHLGRQQHQQHHQQQQYCDHRHNTYNALLDRVSVTQNHNNAVIHHLNSVKETALPSLDSPSVVADTLISADSDLSDLSELSDTEIAMLDTTTSDKLVLRDVSENKFLNVGTDHLVDMERKDADEVEDMDVDESRVSEQLVGFEDAIARPRKRKRMSENDIDTDTAAAVSDFADDNKVHESPPAAGTQSTRPLPSSSPPTSGPDKAPGSNLPDKKTLLPHPKLTLRTAPRQLVQIKLSKSTEGAESSLKMTILPKVELESLKSHNEILRSHNISLARQNLALRHANADAILLRQEVKDNGFVDHADCVRKHDYEELMAENQKLKTEIPRLRYEHQLMQECGMEWARRENMWEVEKDLFKNEVGECVTRIKELETREKELITRLQDTAGRAQHSEQEFAVARARAAVLEEQVVQMQMYIQSRSQPQNVLQLQNGDRSIYPGL